MRDYKLYLDDIRAAIKKIEKYTKGLSLERLRKEDLIIDGIVRNLEVIGEATKNIPPQIKVKYPDIEWKKIAGLRDILAHEYFGIDLEVIWDIVNNKLPVLKKKIFYLLRK
ncbi:MAG: hypothetical protein A2Y00_06580 [Omnitrophica WOR_2 bacterium GWF2_43_52]|nr:MAG: hypothetical protein A2062_03295 [Omnitrophica WOR_2 bacterium GWA2_44_7]OGX21820.1 MAG: hypothetical protein A2Y00_06580 [Omnitrophica WOR_2 bacterium GWF2_43_52]HAH21673.1 DUF86 domain-containing protein [Candidatus Omnitrophota bacterium]HBG64807.1 DUF86 domain-containing protein [Candidatus Omnitrophota bacterium]